MAPATVNGRRLPAGKSKVVELDPATLGTFRTLGAVYGVSRPPEFHAAH
ncbi:hypothetical protein PYR71_23070 [Rhizobium sp. MC63]|uniref:Uncharacterized protein n=1 Tax=Rhizobium mulingense TaxID=3031128 RepID=A0ACC6N2E1_9HYPH|nr:MULTISPECIES: hypothetical protein [unclassified Rhizobium]MDF0699332.1 hypothetical protein [Rhizobium sp. MC63]MEA3519650.1 hypothetical protein [Rhizobium sp. MJ31]MEB3045985.1 hypothetical protein [Rhizobium sp. MJ21]